MSNDMIKNHLKDLEKLLNKVNSGEVKSEHCKMFSEEFTFLGEKQCNIDYSSYADLKTKRNKNTNTHYYTFDILSNDNPTDG